MWKLYISGRMGSIVVYTFYIETPIHVNTKIKKNSQFVSAQQHTDLLTQNGFPVYNKSFAIT